MSDQTRGIIGVKTAYLLRPQQFQIVAVAGVVDWAAYAVPIEACWPSDQIAREGQKILEREAREVWPLFATMPYRR